MTAVGKTTRTIKRAVDAVACGAQVSDYKQATC